MKEIPLTRGQVAMVDDEDYERALTINWHAVYKRNSWYADSASGFLHRFLLDAPRNMFVDHKNQNGLDCRRENMRLATNTQNQHNARKRKDNTSGFRGVHAQKGKWLATVRVNRVKKHLGTFSSPEDAARAYDEAARLHHGEFARLNFPDAT